MSDYTPTTALMREWYVRGDHAGDKSRSVYEAEFDRWLAEVRADEREKIAQAIDAAAYTLTSQDAAKIARSGGESA